MDKVGKQDNPTSRLKKVTGFGKVIITKQSYKDGARWLGDFTIEVIDVFSHFEKNPKRMYLRRLAGVAIIGGMLISVSSLVQGSKAYELSARTSAYSLLSSKDVSPIAFYKMFNELAEIEDISNVNFPVPVKGLKVDGCDGHLLSFLYPLTESACGLRKIENNSITNSAKKSVGIEFDNVNRAHLGFEKILPNSKIKVAESTTSSFSFDGTGTFLDFTNANRINIEARIIHSDLRVKDSEDVTIRKNSKFHYPLKIGKRNLSEIKELILYGDKDFSKSYSQYRYSFLMKGFSEHLKCANNQEYCNDSNADYLDLNSSFYLENLKKARIAFDLETNIELRDSENVTLGLEEGATKKILSKNTHLASEIRKFRTSISLHNNTDVSFFFIPSKMHVPTSYFLTVFHIVNSKNLLFQQDIDHSALSLHWSSATFANNISNSYIRLSDLGKDGNYDFSLAKLTNVFFEAERESDCPKLGTVKNVFSIGTIKCPKTTNITREEAESLFTSLVSNSKSPQHVKYFADHVAWRLTPGNKLEPLGEYFVAKKSSLDNFYPHLVAFRYEETTKKAM